MILDGGGVQSSYKLRKYQTRREPPESTALKNLTSNQYLGFFLFFGGLSVYSPFIKVLLPKVARLSRYFALLLHNKQFSAPYTSKPS